MSTQSSHESDENEDLEVNVLPVIGCFTILIAYTLISASFISLDSMEVSPAITTTAAPTETTISATVMNDGRVLFEVIGKGQASHFEALPGATVVRANEIRKRWPGAKEVSVRAEAGVPYRSILLAVNDLKRPFAKVFIGE